VPLEVVTNCKTVKELLVQHGIDLQVAANVPQRENILKVL